MYRVLALTPYGPNMNPGQRYRVERWAKGLSSRGFVFEQLPFASAETLEVLYRHRDFTAKAARLTRDFLRYAARLSATRKPDLVYIYREAMIVGPAVIERMCRRWGCPIVYDIDEPLFVPYVSPSNGVLSRLKFPGKVAYMLERADHVIAVNEAIANHARSFNSAVSILPVAVDTDWYQPGSCAPHAEFTIAWTGSRSAEKNLEVVLGPLSRLAGRLPLRLVVAGDDGRLLPDAPWAEFRSWTPEVELQLLRECDVGIVPVVPDEWTRWKFYYKLLLYMAMGKPVVATHAGSNAEIIQDGVNGFLVRGPEEWEDRLELLGRDAQLRSRMGAAAASTIQGDLTLEKQLDKLEAIFRSLVNRQTVQDVRRAASGPNADQATVAGFGAEWTRFDQSRLSDAEYDALFSLYFANFPWSRLPQGAVGADFGCGSGRWARGVAPRVARLHCVDASADALSTARKSLAGLGNCDFHHCDITEVPLPDASLDFGYCLGVLHHMPDTQRGLISCTRLLKPGAPLLLYMYYALDNRPWWFRAMWRGSDLLRRLLSRLPFAVRARAADLLALTVYWPFARTARFLERRGTAVGSFPLSVYRHRSLYTMRTDALDRFGTRLEKRFSRNEIERMMNAAGLDNIQFNETPPFWLAVGYRRAEANAQQG